MINTSEDGTSVTVSFEGKSDRETENELECLVASGCSGIRVLYVDMDHVRDITSKMLRILSYAKNIMDRQGAMHILNANDWIVKRCEEHGIPCQEECLEQNRIDRSQGMKMPRLLKHDAEIEYGIRWDDGVLNCALYGRIDDKKALRVESELMHNIGEARKVIFDFAELEELSGQGLAMILDIIRLTPFHNVRIQNESPYIREILDHSGLSKLLSIE